MQINIDYTFVISSCIIVVGWFVNGYLTRKHEIAKKRIDHRLEALNSFLPVFLSITSSNRPFIDDKDLNKKIITARINFQLYGTADEIEAFEKFVIAIESKNTYEATETINELIKLVRKRLRKELGLSALSL